MLAKKKAKKRSSGKGSAKRGGGAPQPVTYAASGTPPAASTGRPAPGSEFASTVDPSAPIEDRLDDVLQKAGIARTQEDMPFAQPQSSGGINPADPLSSIPKKGQELLERFFGGGAIVFGTAFLLSGIAVAVEAICKVSGNPLPTALDEALVQYVEPALTPSILILFFFSISLGLLKQLQLSSESGGVLYSEDED